MNRVDGTEVRRKVEQARARVRGKRARLIGFEAVEIQRFVTASSRPITIQGACEALKGFDKHNEARPETIFAGGTRGLMLVAEDALEGTLIELRRRLGESAFGLSLAVAHVPFDPKDEKGSLRWLRLEQRSAHDACAPEPIELAAFVEMSCADCHARPAELDSPKPEAKPGERICRRCDALIKRGRETQDHAMERWTLEDLAQRGRLGVVSADGNQLGRFFDSLHNLEALRAGSRLISEIFRAAHEAALQRVGDKHVDDPVDDRHVAPITGGDDIKAFLMPTAALDYVSALIRSVEDRAEHAGDVDKLLAGEPHARLKELGVGVGILIAPYHVPATRLVGLAHALEDEAKRERKGRSGVCFAVQRTDGEPDESVRQAVDGRAWAELVERAYWLRLRVPPSQRAAAAAAWELDPAERDNQLLWQIARSRAWQDWYADCRVEWRDRAQALGALRDGALGGSAVLALASLGGRRGKETS